MRKGWEGGGVHLHFIHDTVVSEDYRVRIMLMFIEPEARMGPFEPPLSK
jgi:hypothetical protein